VSEHSGPFHDWKIKWHFISGEANKRDSVITVAAGTGSAAAALIIGVVAVIVVLRKRMAKAKGIIAYVVISGIRTKCIYTLFDQNIVHTGYIWCNYINMNVMPTIHSIRSLPLSYLLNDMYMDKIRFHSNIYTNDSARRQHKQLYL
jgi:hypothetical protein